MICTSCGSNNPDSAKFCVKCGQTLPKMQPKAVSVSSQGFEAHNNANSTLPKKGANQAILNVAIAVIAVLLLGTIGYLVYSNIPQKRSNSQTVETKNEKSDEAQPNNAEVSTEPLNATQSVDMKEEDKTNGVSASIVNESADNNQNTTNRKYSDDELVEKAQLYYYAHYHAYPPLIEVDHYDGSDVVLHLYEYSPEGMTTTWDWYTIDPNTLKGTNFLGDSIDLNDLEVDDSSEYILPESDSRYLSKNDLYGLDADGCRLARNEIYARHGRKFDSEDLQKYFGAKSWYTPTYSASEFQESWLNDYEIYNRDLIVEYEKEMGYR